MTRKRLITFVVIIVVLMSMSIAGNAATRYQASEIIECDCAPDPTTPFTYMYRINNAGQVYGNDRISEMKYQGFVWQNGTKTYLETPDGYSSYAQGINEHGDVSGYIEPGENQGCIGVVWENGKMHMLNSPPQVLSSMPKAINDYGTVVGFSSELTPEWNYRYRPAAWEDDNYIGLEIADLKDGLAHSINNNGVAAGFAEYKFDLGYDRFTWDRAVIWQNGVATQLFEPNLYGPSIAYDINDNDQVVGCYHRTDTLLNTAFLWQNGKHIDLPDFHWNDDWEYSEIAYAINNSGHVVGTASDLAISWEDGVAYDLKSQLVNDQGWWLRLACGINDSGQILAWGVLRDGDSGRAGLVVLTPVPEPSSIFVLLCGLGSLGVLQYRKVTI